MKKSRTRAGGKSHEKILKTAGLAGTKSATLFFEQDYVSS